MKFQTRATNFFVALVALCTAALVLGATPPPEMLALRVGHAMHAFDHLGDISGQAEIAAACGATLIYDAGLGAEGYQGLPAPQKLITAKKASAQYVRNARSDGIQLLIGYVCATSMVNLESFDKQWPTQFRGDFQSPPAAWRQQGRNGKPLDSWYGTNYAAACMNNPDWRNYEKFIVRQQIETGHDGVFFDNPTVHPEGCYCPFCMEKFANHLKLAKIEILDHSLEGVRHAAVQHPGEFRRFRCTIARDFLADMRAFARALNRNALVTCNNSLNSPDVFYSQCTTHAYNIDEMSQAEDYIVVEDIGHQPRALANGKFLEYGPTYQLLHAVSHGKPIAAVTVAETDYHTPPNLARLAMAEAAAHNASYIFWPTWPEKYRPAMVAALRPQIDLLRQQESILNDTRARRDVLLFLPFRRWLETNHCVALDLAAALTRSNIQFEVFSEGQFDLAHLKTDKQLPVLLIESDSVLTEPERRNVKKFERAGGNVILADKDPNWLATIGRIGHRSMSVDGPPAVRAIVRDQPKRTIVHLFNLNIERISSFEDKVHPAEDVRLTCRVPFPRVGSVWALTADENGTSNAVGFTAKPAGKESTVELVVPRLDISTMILIEP